MAIMMTWLIVQQKMFEDRVREIGADMSELSAIQYVLAEMRAEGMRDGGIMSLESFAYGGLAKMLGE